MVSGSRGHNDSGHTSPIQPGSPTSPMPAAPGGPQKKHNFGVVKSPVVLKPAPAQQKGGPQQQAATGVASVAKKAMPLPLTPLQKNPALAQRMKANIAKTHASPLPALPGQAKVTGSPAAKKPPSQATTQGVTGIAQKALPKATPNLLEKGKMLQASLPPLPNISKSNALDNTAGIVTTNIASADPDVIKHAANTLQKLLMSTSQADQNSGLEVIERLTDEDQAVLFGQMSLASLQQIARLAPDLDDIDAKALTDAIVKKGLDQLERAVNAVANKSPTPRKALDRATLEKAFTKAVAENNVDLTRYLGKWDELVALFTDQDKTALAWGFVNTLRPFVGGGGQASPPAHASAAGVHASAHSPESGVTRRGAQFTGAPSEAPAGDTTETELAFPATGLDDWTVNFYDGFVRTDDETRKRHVQSIPGVIYANDPAESIKYFIELSSLVEQDPTRFEHEKNGVDYLMECAKEYMASSPADATQALSELLSHYQQMSEKTAALAKSIQITKDLLEFVKGRQS